MKKMFVLINHNLTEGQKAQAFKVFGVEKIVNVTDDAWSNINPSDENILHVLDIYKKELKREANTGDILFVQGDFGATYNMINFAKSIGMKTIYATTKRIVQEFIVDEKLVTKREFKHEKFREYL